MDIQTGDKFLWNAKTVFVIVGRFEHKKESFYRIRCGNTKAIRSSVDIQRRIARGSWVSIEKHIVPLKKLD